MPGSAQALTNNIIEAKSPRTRLRPELCQAARLGEDIIGRAAKRRWDKPLALTPRGTTYRR